MPYTFCEKIGKEIHDISGELPFEILDSWEWVRLKSITRLVTKGTTPRDGNVAYLEDGIGFLRAENVAGYDKLNKDKLNYIDDKTHNGYLKRSILEENDILITIAGTLGRTGLVRESDLPLNANQAVSMIRLVDVSKINLLYLIYTLNSPLIQKSLTTQKKITAIPNLTLEIIADCMVPLPPLAEQHRIVAKIGELLPYIEKYEQAETQLTKLNKDFPELLKKSILQEAVQGKLVPQDSNDEPASVLLERIRAEKQALIKAGKIKKDKHESVIVTRDKIPYEIPDSWVWCTLSSVINLVSGQDFEASDFNTENKGIPYLTGASNIENEKVILNRWTETPRCISNKDDLLVVCKGAGVGKMCILEENKVHIARQIMSIQPINMDVKYIKAFLGHNLLSLRKNMQGVIPGISRDIILSMPIPLPPLAEQHRIVSKIEEIMTFFEKLK